MTGRRRMVRPDRRGDSTMTSPSRARVFAPSRGHGSLTGRRYVDPTGADWREVRYDDGTTGWRLGRSLRSVVA